MLSLSVEETRELLTRIYRLESELAIGKSDIERAVEETKRLYSTVRRVEGEIRKYATYMMMGGVTIPGMAALGPYMMFVPLIFEVSTMVSEEVTRRELIRLRMEMELEMRQYAEKLVATSRVEAERERRECWRSLT